MPSRRIAVALGFLALLLAQPLLRAAEEKPKVRAVTAFLRLDRATYRAQIADTMKVLRRAKAVLEQAGYEVQSLRIATQPFPEYTRDLTPQEAVAFFREYAALAEAEGFNAAIGPAMVAAGDDPAQASRLGEILLAAPALNGSLVVAGADGVHWPAVRAAARLMRHLADNSPGGQANFSFAATARIPEHTPFFPGAYHTGEGRKFAVALQSANVVAEALGSTHDLLVARRALAAALGRHAGAIEAVAVRLAGDTGWEYMGLDLSPAPLKDVSIGAALEGFTGAPVGSSGTMSAAALVTDVLRSLPVRRAGYSGLMLPVLEDSVLAERWSEGRLNLDALLAYSAVCGTGLDTVPLPGDVSEEQLARIIGDMASLAVKLDKPLSARLMPVPGKGPGQQTTFDDPFLVNAVLQRLP